MDNFWKSIADPVVAACTAMILTWLAFVRRMNRMVDKVQRHDKEINRLQHDNDAGKEELGDINKKLAFIKGQLEMLVKQQTGPKG